MSWFLDYDDGDFCMPLSDSMAVDSDGNYMLRISEHMSMDMDSGDIHYTSSWDDEDD